MKPHNHTPQDWLDVGAIVVAFDPDEGVEGRLVKIARQVRRLVIVDNSEDLNNRRVLESVCISRGWDLISYGTNDGLGAALNNGIRHLAAHGLGWALLFDQDSDPEPDMCHHLVASWQRHPDAQHVAVIGPKFVDTLTGRAHRVLRCHPSIHWWFQKVEVGDTDFPSVTMVITSGSLLNIQVFEECGAFDAGLFIDYVDTDFCLKCLARGLLVAVSGRATMRHRLGNRQRRRWLGFTMHPTNHPALRHFYVSRNRVIMWKRHARKFPHWAIFDFAAIALWVVRVLTVEDDKAAKLGAMVRGTWAGLKNESGRSKAFAGGHGTQHKA